MKHGKNSFFQNGTDRLLELSKNQLVSIENSFFEIDCLQGYLWITWPNGHEITLSKGESFKIESKGKVCILALSNAIAYVMVGLHESYFKKAGASLGGG